MGLFDHFRFRWRVGTAAEPTAVEPPRSPVLLAGWWLDLAHPTFDVWTRAPHDCDLCGNVTGLGPWIAIPIRQRTTGRKAEFLVCPGCFENPPKSIEDVPPTW